MEMSKLTAIVLTGGIGTRMRPLSLDKEKSMIDFMGRPLLLHLIKMLRSYGFSNIVFTSQGKRGEIKEYFSDGRAYGVNIEYYKGKKWYGTAGTIKQLIDKMGDAVASDNLLVIYGDSLLKADFKKMLQFHGSSASLCTILYHHPRFKSFMYEYHDREFEERGKRTNYGVMDVGPGNRISAVMEKPAIAQLEDYFINPVANAAVYAIKKDLLKYVPKDYPYDFPRNLFPLLIEKGIPCFGFDIEDGYRLDIGTIPTYYTAHFAILHGKVDFEIDFPEIEESVWLGKSSSVNPRGKLEGPLLICENCSIGPGTNISHSIIGNNVNIGSNCLIKKSIILDNVHIGDGVEISYSILGEHSSVAHGTFLSPNTVLGSYCRLGDFQLALNDSDFYGLIRR